MGLRNHFYNPSPMPTAQFPPSIRNWAPPMMPAIPMMPMVPTAQPYGAPRAPMPLLDVPPPHMMLRQPSPPLPYGSPDGNKPVNNGGNPWAATWLPVNATQPNSPMRSPQPVLPPAPQNWAYPTQYPYEVVPVEGHAPSRLSQAPQHKPLPVAQPPQQSVTPPPAPQPRQVSSPQRITNSYSTAMTPWTNRLKSMLQNNEAVIYALNIRTFGAHDKNLDGEIDPARGESGTFLSSIDRLDELQAMGVNTIHLLPINALGEMVKLGEAGSLYAPSDYHRLNEQFDTPGNGLTVLDEARMFVDECHKRGIHVMVDVPSCASYDLAAQRPDLIAFDENGNPKTPTNWVDILMLQGDSPELRQYFDGFFNLMTQGVGVDGFRVDVVRARPYEFWDYFHDRYPNHGWLAESYVKEDASPLKNIPADDPEGYLRTGMDSMYGQLHIFHLWPSADEYINYMLETRELMKRASWESGTGNKSLLGSFLTHDDPSLMTNGGPLMYFLASGLMATQPWTVPYVLDGYNTGYTHEFDIFNYEKRPEGKHPEIGAFTQYMFNLRQGPWKDIVTRGSFIPLSVQTEDKNNQIIAFARHYQGKTLLVLANKDVNARHQGAVNIPTLPQGQPLVNLAPEYGKSSQVMQDAADPSILNVDLGPGRLHVFEINTPTLPQVQKAYD